MAELEGADALATLDLRAGRQAYVLCVEGSCELSGGVALGRHDAAEVTGSGSLTVKPAAGSQGGAHVLVVEMAHSGDGRTDL